MINKERIDFLLKQYVSDNLSVGEREELLQYLQDTPEDVLSEDMLRVVERLRSNDILEETPSQRIWQAVVEDPRVQKKTIVRRIQSRCTQYFPHIAVAMVLIAISTVFFLYKNNTWQTHQIDASSTLADVSDLATTIKPGTQQATLTLPDGQIVVLDNLHENKLIKGEGFELHIVDGEIQYNAGGQLPVSAETTLRTPRGGEYQMHLPDGTQVWLNAGSSITYPLCFATDIREVSIEGEAFFEVKKDQTRPFVVRADQTSITVLGTQFNVSVYPEDTHVETTLIEGSVRLQKGETVRLLKPGQQASISKEKDQHIAVRSVDTEEITAWKNGYFYFQDEDIKSAMDKIGRWYDVDIAYKDKLSQRGLDGTISRMENLDQLLKALELTGTAKFTLEGRRVIVSE